MLPELDTPTTAMLATVTGLGFLVTIIVEIILRAWQPDGVTKDRFGPLLAFGIAFLLAILGTVSAGLDVTQALLLAVVTAGVGMGIHDTAGAATTTR